MVDTQDILDVINVIFEYGSTMNQTNATNGGVIFPFSSL